MNTRPAWATHTFKNASGQVVWFNPASGQASNSANCQEVVLERKSHYAFERCEPIKV